jgi:transcriptional antiterminator NusG
MFQWYALRVRGGRERQVAEAVQAAVEKHGLQEELEDIKVPFEVVTTVKKGKKTEKKRYFTYIFVSLKLEKPTNIKNVLLDVLGVYGFMGADGWEGSQEPMPIAAEEIDKMFGKADEGELTEQEFVNLFAKGDRVRVLEGVLKGREVEIDSVSKDGKKIIIMVELFGNRMPTSLTAAQIEKLS